MLYDRIIRGRIYKFLYGRDRAVVPSLQSEVRVILDVGCGTGFATRELARIGNAIGIDKEIRFLRAAKALKAGAFILGDASRLPFNDDTFDLICMYDLLHHHVKPEEAVREAKRVLKEHGHLFVKDVKKCLRVEYYLNIVADCFEFILYRCPLKSYFSEGEWEKLLRGFDKGSFSSFKNEIFFLGEKTGSLGTETI